MIDGLIVRRDGRGIEQGGEGSGGRERAERAVEGVGGEWDELLDGAGKVTGGGEDGVSRGEGAGPSGALGLGAVGDALDVVEQWVEVDVAQIEGRRLGEGAALGDGIGDFAAVAGDDGKAQQGGGVALDDPMLTGEQPAGDGDGIGALTEQVAEA